MSTVTPLDRLVNIWDGAIVADAVEAAESEQQDLQLLPVESFGFPATGGELVPFCGPPTEESVSYNDPSGGANRSDDELLYHTLPAERRSRRKRRRHKPDVTAAQMASARAADQSIDESELTVWELCLRNRRPLTEEDRMKLAERKNARKDPTAMNRAALPTTSSAADDLSALFGGSSERISTGDEGLLSGSTSAMDALFDGPMMGDNMDGTNRDELFELTIQDGSESSKLAPFHGAYKVGIKSKWSDEATKRFYAAVEMYGCDAHLINVILPEFTNKEITRKIRTELKKNQLKMEAASKVKRKLTIDAFIDARGEIDPSTHFRPPALLDGGHHTQAKQDGKQEIQTKRDLSTMGNLIDDLFGASTPKIDHTADDDSQENDIELNDALFDL